MATLPATPLTSAATAVPPRAVIVVFARLPVAGKVKTRLAAGVGPAAAAQFYKLCAEHAAVEVLSCPLADGIVFCSAAEDEAGVTAWLRDAGALMPVQPQVHDPDLGHRMIAALTAAATGAQAAPSAPGSPTATIAMQQLQQALGSRPEGARQQEPGSKFPYEAAVVIGTDIPDITSEVLSAAVTGLLGATNGTDSAELPGAAPADMILGPAADGGFYLLGFRTESLLRADVQHCRVFEGVQWSCSTVLQRTLAAAGRLGLRIAPVDTLPTLQDVDTYDDAAAWLTESSPANGQHANPAAEHKMNAVRQLICGWVEGRSAAVHNQSAAVHNRLGLGVPL